MVIIFFQVARLVVVNEIGLSLHRFFGIEVSGKQFVLYLDKFQRFFGNGFRNRNHTRDVVSDVAHFVERERVLIMTDGKNSIRIRRVFANYDSHDSIQLFGTSSIDMFYARVRIRRMQNLPNQHPGHAEIVGIFAATGGFFRRIDHGGGLADNAEVTHRGLVI